MRSPAPTLALAALLVSLAGPVLATEDQPRKANPSDPDIELPVNPYLTYSRPRQWVVRQTVYLLIPQFLYLDHHQRIQEGENERFPEEIEFVYPLMYQSGSSWADPDEEVQGSVYSNNHLLELEPTIAYAAQTNVPYSIWAFSLRDTRVLRFDITTSVISVDTTFHESEAVKLPWPDQWPLEASVFLTPIIDSLGTPSSPPLTDPPNTPILPPDETVITDLVAQWTEGNDPKAIAPVLLAKFLTGKVAEHIYSNDRSLVIPGTSGFNKSLASNTGPGSTYTFNQSGTYAGFEVRNADEAARSGRGSRHDMTILLTAVFRAAGLPARSVIGIDDDRSGKDRVRSWTEFAIYDADLDLVVWIPVDIDELDGRGIRASQYKRPWKFFGTNDELHTIAPVAHYFHPPAAYQSFQVPALYGIRSSEELSPITEQIITFGINRKTVRGGQQNKNPNP